MASSERNESERERERETRETTNRRLYLCDRFWDNLRPSLLGGRRGGGGGGGGGRGGSSSFSLFLGLRGSELVAHDLSVALLFRGEAVRGLLRFGLAGVGSGARLTFFALTITLSTTMKYKAKNKEKERERERERDVR
jgi:hypothetical protein